MPYPGPRLRTGLQKSDLSKGVAILDFRYFPHGFSQKVGIRQKGRTERIRDGGTRFSSWSLDCRWKSEPGNQVASIGPHGYLCRFFPVRPWRCVITGNLALPKTGGTSAELKQGGLRRSPSVSAMPKRGNGLAWRSTYSGLWLCTRFAQSLRRCFGATENRLHLGQKQCKSKAEAKLVLAMLRRNLRSLESKLKPTGLVRHSVCTVFRVSNSVTNRSASRTQRASLLALC